MSWESNVVLLPFECLMKSKTIEKRIVIDLYSDTQNEYANNILHTIAKCKSSRENDAIKIAKLSIDAYKQETEAQQSSNIFGDQFPIFPWLVESRRGLTQ